jgi:putative inorganic carbon (HCO3(-)) transporter
MATPAAARASSLRTPSTALPPWVARAGAACAGGLGVALLGLVLARAPLEAAFAVVIGGIGLVAIVWRPALGLYALAFAIPFGSVREVTIAGASVGVSQALALVTIAAWLARRLAFPRRVAFPRCDAPLLGGSAIPWALAAYLGALLVALWPAQSIPLAAKEMAKWIEFAAVLMLTAGELGPRETRGLVAALLLAGALQGLLGAYQFVRQIGPPGFILMGRFMRAHGTFAQPNPYGGFLGLLLPLSYATVVATWREAWPPGRRRHPGRLLLWGLALVATVTMAAGLVMSWSRGALLGAAAGAGLVLLAMGRRVWLALAVVVLLATPVVASTPSVVPTVLVERLTEALDYIGAPDVTAIEVTDANFANLERLAHWRAAWRMFERAPWLGVGTGQYAAVYPTVAVPRWEDPLGHAHNILLNVMAEGGLLALAAYLGLMAAAVWTTWRAARGAHGLQRAVTLGSLGMMGHLLAHNMVDNLYVHEMYLLIAMLLGMVLAQQRRAGLVMNRSKRGTP